MKRYGIIYADPPWFYDNRGVAGNAAQHYKLMSTSDIKSLNIRSISADNCALFLWATMPCLPDAIDVMRSWGFNYKTVAFTWVKSNSDNKTPFLGTGFYTRANPELCLLGTKGSMSGHVVSHAVPQLLFSPRRQHSRKPYCMYPKMEELFGKLPRCELFARDTVTGWDRIDGDYKVTIGTVRLEHVDVQCDGCNIIYHTTVCVGEPFQCPNCGYEEVWNGGE